MNFPRSEPGTLLGNVARSEYRHTNSRRTCAPCPHFSCVVLNKAGPATYG